MSVIPLYISHIVCWLIPPKCSILVVLNALHLGFSLASVSGYFFEPIFTHADLKMWKFAVPALQNPSVVISFTQP